LKADLPICMTYFEKISNLYTVVIFPRQKDSGNWEAFRASRVTANQREATAQFLKRLLLAEVL
jgi:hypothetical protein